MGCGVSGEEKSGSNGHDRDVSLHGQAPPKRLIALRDAFCSVDSDGNGILDATEFGRILTKVNSNQKVLSEQDETSLFNAIDKDKNGSMTYEEFADWVLTQEEKCQEDQAESIVQWAENGGLNPLHEAAMQGDIVKLKECLDGGTDVNVGDLQDVTPLHFACRCGHLEIVNALVESNANIAATSHRGCMPLHAAAGNGTLPAIQRLLALGAELNAKDRDGRTPLHWAAITQSSSAEPTKALLDACADLAVTTKLYRTPLHFAARAGNADVVEILIAAKADINARNTEKGNTPLHAAAGSRSLKATQLLVDAGADIHALDNAEMTPLHWAVCASKLQTVSVLLEARADVNAKTQLGYTPLGLAEEWCCSGMTKLLEKAGGAR